MSGPSHMFLSLQCDSVAAGTDEEWYVGIPDDGTWRIVEVHVVPQTARTANATDYFTLTIKKGSTTLATRALSASNMVAGTPEELTITESGTNNEFTKTAPIQVHKDDTGTAGLAFDGCVCFKLQKVR